ncbi:hypothetical protein SASPL_100508 [Salvia splendens]|uniref:3-hydroxyisobutyryl-CoA hydrolase n=1 Tax=Salvia splendens TaxID=180675 RepID=A0A8X8YP92_SALSN|nr:hypothetical protein SASPL_100508 [Salvia splendens]
MRLCKYALIRRWMLPGEKLSYGSRRFTSLSTNPLIHDSDNLVLVEGKASSRTAILNRPAALNALNMSIVGRLQELYKNWEEDPAVCFVAVKGGGRAFSAGGDIVALYNLLQKGTVFIFLLPSFPPLHLYGVHDFLFLIRNLEECKQFFWSIYRFIYFLGTYMKPHVALLNGITMGGGAGVSIPGTFRLAADKTV